MDEQRIPAAVRDLAAGMAPRRALARRAAALAALALATRGAGARKRKKRCRCRPKALGEFCTANKQCCPNQTNRICGKPTVGNTPRCCGGLGAGCGAGGDCCVPFSCESGVCNLLV